MISNSIFLNRFGPCAAVAATAAATEILILSTLQKIVRSSNFRKGMTMMNYKEQIIILYLYYR